MDVALVTGSAGLIGGEAVEFLADKVDQVVGVDNDMRKTFFGPEASTAWNRDRLQEQLSTYVHRDLDIRDQVAVDALFRKYGSDIALIVHTAAQPSHDWAAQDPFADFTINANGTLVLLEAMRRHCPDAVFVYTSTNKVYGDRPNTLPLVEWETRWELDDNHPYAEYGIDEQMSIDQSKHSLFGASKAAADLLVQEYGRYFGLKTGVFRGGCLTGPHHSGAQLHGFLSYLMKCAITGERYTIFGFKGKQVRDNIHAHDFIRMLWHFYQSPREGEVYNAGGSRFSNCSMLEAIRLCEDVTGNEMNYEYSEKHRAGDHIWWISDIRKFQEHYPEWTYMYGLGHIISQIYDALTERLRTG